MAYPNHRYVIQLKAFSESTYVPFVLEAEVYPNQGYFLKLKGISESADSLVEPEEYVVEEFLFQDGRELKIHGIPDPSKEDLEEYLGEIDTKEVMRRLNCRPLNGR